MRARHLTIGFRSLTPRRLAPLQTNASAQVVALSPPKWSGRARGPGIDHWRFARAHGRRPTPVTSSLARPPGIWDVGRVVGVQCLEA